VVYVDRKAHHKLAEGFDYVIPAAVYHDASGSSRFGDALSLLLPHLFPGDELCQPTVKALDQEKVSALIGRCPTSFFFFFLSFFFFFFFFFFF